MAQQVERLDERHTGFQERRQFLVENEEFVPGDLLAFREQAPTAQESPPAKRKHVETLVFEIVAKPSLALGCVIAFDNLARGGHEPAAKFHG
jgi:hypothetical protein